MAGQREVVRDLVAGYLAGPRGRLDPDLLADWKAADSDAAALRVVVDQVASLTDVRATAPARAPGAEQELTELGGSRRRVPRRPP